MALNNVLIPLSILATESLDRWRTLKMSNSSGSLMVPALANVFGQILLPFRR